MHVAQTPGASAELSIWQCTALDIALCVLSSAMPLCQGLSQGVDHGGALGPADMVALAAAYPFIFIKASFSIQTCSRAVSIGA